MDTLVSTEDGLRPIEEIQAGDYVWSENTETGKKELKKVLSVSVTETTTLVHVTTENGTVINTTENHPFYVEGKGWCAAAELETGDVLRTEDGEQETVKSVQTEKLDKAVKVYNLEIEDSHTYYVSADRVLVHNACGEGEKFSRNKSFRDAKRAAKIPTSNQYITHKFVYDGSTENRTVYEFNVDGIKKFIIEHREDRSGRGSHFHWADDEKGDPFNRGRYNQREGHFPENFKGFY